MLVKAYKIYVATSRFDDQISSKGKAVRPLLLSQRPMGLWRCKVTHTKRVVMRSKANFSTLSRPSFHPRFTWTKQGGKITFQANG